ncbi:hypothetical protein ACIGB6_07950 [Paeniglutamicibacter gangotriensis]|uniref:hypothetical protein n=1 Tax=Paeniglutamicibacter gangotriensis TaxID=254787 RepID=UPI0037CA3E77
MPDPDQDQAQYQDQDQAQVQDPAPRRKKPRRFTAEPQRVSESSLVGVFELPHGAGRPATGVPGDPATTSDGGKGSQGEQGSTPRHGSAATEPVAAPVEALLEQRAAEDSPRAWGDSEDDLGEWMKSQRPPHWD